MTGPDTRAYPPRETAGDIEHGLLLQPRFNADGLLPAIVTDDRTGEVLMLAWMNDQALALTVETRLAHFWSRSRKRLWRKGEESGNELTVKDIRIDCDQDTVWLRVDVGGAGVTCHTGARSCFYRSVSLGPGQDRRTALVNVPGEPGKRNEK